MKTVKSIRPIQKSDNPIIARIIRQVLTEFGANKPGFAWQDPELDRMSEAYAHKGAGYWILEVDGRVVGGGGVAPFGCEYNNCCELQKMYLLPEVRGKGWGADLINMILKQVKILNYDRIYLETLDSMGQATKLYESSGFSILSQPLGQSGHDACDKWYLKNMSDT